MTVKQVSLDEKEIRTILEVLKFAEGACPTESIDPDFAIDAEKTRGHNLKT